MGKNKATTAKTQNDFVPQPKWKDMTPEQREGWKWGARAKANMVKENLGLKKPRD